MNLVVIALLFFSLVLSGASFASSPLGRSTWARPLGMGNAYVGLADDTASLYTNSSGIVQVKRNNFLSVYSKPESDISFTSLGGVFPDLLNGSLGIGYRNRIVSGVVVSSTETIDTLNHDLLLSYARKINEKLSVAADLRYLLQSVTENMPGIQSGSGVAFGLSAQYQHSPDLKFGLAAQDLGLKMQYSNGTSDTFQANLTAGASFKVRKNLAVDLDLSKDGEEQLLAHLGGEWWPTEIFALRLGLDQTPNGLDSTFNNLTFGLGIKNAGITFDYAYYANANTASSSSHYFSLGYVGQDPPPFTSQEELRPAYPEPTPKQVRASIPIRHFRDLADDPRREAIELLATAGMLSGYPDNTFRPDQPLTKKQFVAMIYKAKNLVLPDNLDQAITALRQAGDLPRFNDLLIEADKNELTRGEAAQMLYNTDFAQRAIKRLPPLVE